MLCRGLKDAESHSTKDVAHIGSSKLHPYNKSSRLKLRFRKSDRSSHKKSQSLEVFPSLDELFVARLSISIHRAGERLRH